MKPSSHLGARPFSSLGAKPFLSASTSDLAQLQSEFHKRSRIYHPDRFLNASDEERQEAETQSAALNADYARLRDPIALIDTVLENDKSANDAQIQARRSGPPPELAAEYFELQESLAENGPTHPNTQRALKEFSQQVRERRAGAETKLMELARRFPFAGFGEAPAPWTSADLELIRKATFELRYYKSFENDITRRLGLTGGDSN